MAVHTALVQQVRVLTDGSVVTPSSDVNYMEVATASLEMRVVFDATHAPNAVDWPTIPEYLAIEDAAGFFFAHMDNVFIITRQ